MLYYIHVIKNKIFITTFFLIIFFLDDHSLKQSNGKESKKLFKITPSLK